MEYDPTPEKTHGPLASSSGLQRYNASPAEFLNCDMNEFILTLADHHSELIMTKIEVVADTTEEPEMERIQIEQPTMLCPRCKEEVANSSELVNHIYTHLEDNEVLKIMKKAGVLTAEGNALLVKAQETQMHNSSVKIKIENRDFTVSCPMSSPLFRFMAMRHLKIYMDEEPISRSIKHRIVKIELKRPDRTYDLFFCWASIDKNRAKIKKRMAEKREKHLERFHQKQYGKNNIATDDLVHKKMRSSEENEGLAKALNLPTDFTQEQLQAAIGVLEAKKPVIPENKMQYNAQEDQDGNKLNKEQRKLISTLTGNMMFVPDGKRRTRNRTARGQAYDTNGASELEEPKPSNGTELKDSVKICSELPIEECVHNDLDNKFEMDSVNDNSDTIDSNSTMDSIEMGSVDEAMEA